MPPVADDGAPRRSDRTVAGGLPTGTVTFLFTDIVGSTRLLREDRRAYADMLAQHRLRSILDGAALNRRNGSLSSIVHALEGLAAVALAEHRPAVAARALAAVESAVQNIKTPLWPVLAPLLRDLTARAQLARGDHAFAAACAEGGQQALLQAVDQALEDLAVSDRGTATA
jgi:class 3 adenylate cyclase